MMHVKLYFVKNIQLYRISFSKLGKLSSTSTGLKAFTLKLVSGEKKETETYFWTTTAYVKLCMSTLSQEINIVSQLLVFTVMQSKIIIKTIKKIKNPESER